MFTYRKLGFRVKTENKKFFCILFDFVNTCSRSPEKAGLLSVANNILTELRSMPGTFGLVLKWASSLKVTKTAFYVDDLRCDWCRDFAVKPRIKRQSIPTGHVVGCEQSSQTESCVNSQHSQV